MSDETATPLGAEVAPEPVAAVAFENAPITAGARLKAARESAGLSVTDVAQRLKYSPRQVQALEDGNADALPSLTFQRGFVRGYAKLLGLEPSELVASLESQSVAAGGPSTLQLQQVAYSASAMPATASNNSAWPWVLGMLLAVGGIGGYALYDWEAPSAVKRNVTPASSAAPAADTAVASERDLAKGEAPGAVVSAILAPVQNGVILNNGERLMPLPQPHAEIVPPDTTSATPLADVVLATSGKLRMVFGAESWAEIRQANGEVVYSSTAKSGAERWADGQAPFDVVIGNAKDVKLFYRGQEVDLTPYIKVSVARLQLK